MLNVDGVTQFEYEEMFKNFGTTFLSNLLVHLAFHKISHMYSPICTRHCRATFYLHISQINLHCHWSRQYGPTLDWLGNFTKPN